VHLGWGKVIDEIDPIDLIAAEKSAYAADILYLITLALSKYSLALLFLRLSPDPNHARVSKWVAYFSGLWVVASVTAIGVRCHLQHPWIDITADQCPTMLVRWQVISAFNIITEAAVFSMSIYLVIGLHMSLARKSMVVIAFGLRLPVIALCALRIHYFFDAFYSSDPTFDGAFYATWTQAELAFSIMASTIPCLKPLMSQLNTNWGGKNQMHIPEDSAALYKVSSSGNYSLRQFTRKSGKSGKSGKSEKGGMGVWQTAIRGSVVRTEELDGDNAVNMSHKSVHDGLTISHQMLRGDSVSHAANATHERGFCRDGSIQSNDSQQMIIRKEVVYSVEYGGRSTEGKSDVNATSENLGVHTL